jgi:hypothetical protein
MSALGQKQTSEYVRTMSALPPKADIAEGNRHVRIVPKADIGRLIRSPRLHLLTDYLEGEPERLGSFHSITSSARSSIKNRIRPFR